MLGIQIQGVSVTFCHFPPLLLSLGLLEEFVFYMLSLAFLAVSKRFQRNDKSFTDAIFSEDDDIDNIRMFFFPLVPKKLRGKMQEIICYYWKRSLKKLTSERSHSGQPVKTFELLKYFYSCIN